VGGHLSGFDLMFAAIVLLNGSSALPAGSPFEDEEVVAQAVFRPTTLSSDIRVPLSVILVPGDYAVIFGSGLFGAGPSEPLRAVGAMTMNNQQLSGSSKFFWNGFRHT